MTRTGHLIGTVPTFRRRVLFHIQGYNSLSENVAAVFYQTARHHTHRRANRISHAAPFIKLFQPAHHIRLILGDLVPSAFRNVLLRKLGNIWRFRYVVVPRRLVRDCFP